MNAELPDGTRVIITRGNPSDDELAAVVVALARARSRPAGGPARRSGWVEAARREGVGLEPDADATR